MAPSGAAQRTDEPIDGEDAPRFELVAHPDLHMGGWERCMRHRELVCRSSVRVRAAGQRLAGEAWAGGESSDAPPLAGPVSPLTERPDPTRGRAGNVAAGREITGSPRMAGVVSDVSYDTSHMSPST